MLFNHIYIHYVPLMLYSRDTSQITLLDIHGRKGKALFFRYIPDTTRDIINSDNLYTNTTKCILFFKLSQCKIAPWWSQFIAGGTQHSSLMSHVLTPVTRAINLLTFLRYIMSSALEYIAWRYKPYLVLGFNFFSSNLLFFSKRCPFSHRNAFRRQQFRYHSHHHHQPIYDPSASVQYVPFLWIIGTRGERAIIHHDRWVLSNSNVAVGPGYIYVRLFII
jgi:hypothetical protein